MEWCLVKHRDTFTLRQVCLSGHRSLLRYEYCYDYLLTGPETEEWITMDERILYTTVYEKVSGLSR
jgi:hypothetical protein